MIIIFRLIFFIVLFINFRISRTKINILFIIQIFIEIKRIRYFLVKLMLGLIIFLFLNYNSYIYYSVGLTINYGYVFIYAFSLVIVL